MTITTAKLAGAVRRAYATPLAMGALLLAGGAAADEWRFTPTLDVRETWTDNVNQGAGSGARSQFIHEVAPGMRWRMNGPRLLFSGNAEYHRYFNLHNRPGTRESSRNLNTVGKAQVVDDLFYVDANASISQQTVSAFGRQFNTAGYAIDNQREVRTWRVSPYLVHGFGNFAGAEVRYVRDSVDAGDSGLDSSDGDTLLVRLNSGRSFKRFGWGLSASEQRVDNSISNDYTIQTANLNLRYALGRTVDMTGAVGYDSYDYQALGGATEGKSWSAGLAWTPGARTAISASVGRRYFGPSRQFSALHRSRRTVWSITYDDAVSNTRQNYLIPSTLDTASLLDQLFTPTFPDADARARAVEEYIRITGLPSALPNNINYFSNRFVLQKQLRATMAYKTARTGGTVSLFRIERNALSVRETDSPILGTTLNSINDNIEQRGISTSGSYRLTGRTTLNALADLIDNRSLSTGAEARSHALRFNMRHQLAARMVGTVELRHLKGNTGVTAGRRYTENAISAAVSMQL